MPEDNGYEAVFGELPVTEKLEIIPYQNGKLDALKLKYIQKLVDLTKKEQIKLIFVLSPNYRNDPSLAFDTIKGIAVQNNILFMNYYNEPLLMKPKYFRDVMHLNDEGAHVWSSYFSNKLKQILNKEIFKQ